MAVNYEYIAVQMFDIIKDAYLIRIYKRNADYVSTLHTELPIPYIPQQPVFLAFFQDNDNTLFMQDPIYFFLFDIFPNNLRLYGPNAPSELYEEEATIMFAAKSGLADPIYVHFKVQYIEDHDYDPYQLQPNISTSYISGTTDFHLDVSHLFAAPNLNFAVNCTNCLEGESTPKLQERFAFASRTRLPPQECWKTLLFERRDPHTQQTIVHHICAYNNSLQLAILYDDGWNE